MAPIETFPLPHSQVCITCNSLLLMQCFFAVASLVAVILHYLQDYPIKLYWCRNFTSHCHPYFKHCWKCTLSLLHLPVTTCVSITSYIKRPFLSICCWKTNLISAPGSTYRHHLTINLEDDDNHPLLSAFLNLLLKVEAIEKGAVPFANVDDN